MGLRQVLRHIGQAESGQRRMKHLGRFVEDELAVDAHSQFAVPFFELPGVEPAMGGQAQIDAVVTEQFLRRAVAGDRFARYDGAPTTAMRMSGPIRTAIMSFATCSPRRTPAS